MPSNSHPPSTYMVYWVGSGICWRVVGGAKGGESGCWRSGALVGVIEINASSYPIKSLYFNGTANWTGIYGLTGKFEGWFSDDEARIPVKAKMKLYVGNANIELVKWSRGNCTATRRHTEIQSRSHIIITSYSVLQSHIS